jgi:hypothetical protein
LAKYGRKFGGNLLEKLGCQIRWQIGWKHCFEKMGETIRLNNLFKKMVESYLTNLLYNFGEKFIGKNVQLNLVKIGFYIFSWSIELKIGWKIKRKCWVEKLCWKKFDGKSAQCNVYIEQCSSVCWGSLGVPQFGELLRLLPPEALVFHAGTAENVSLS